MIETIKQKNILYVEDDVDLRKVVADYLEELGYRVVTVDNGESASRAFKEMTPDLALVDASLPDMSGLDICKWAKHDERLAGVPIMIVSGKTTLQDKLQGFLSGAERYLCKPFLMEDLAEGINIMLEAIRIKHSDTGANPPSLEHVFGERRRHYEYCSESAY